MEDLLQHIAFEADLRNCFSESNAQLEGSQDRTWQEGALRVCVRTNKTQTFEREPGRTADPSAALGMTKGRVTRP
jgi:hypothetical protein